MKYVKLIFSLFVLAVALLGVVYLLTREKVTITVTPKTSTIKEIKIEQRIKDKIDSAPNNSFCTEEYDEILNSINRFFDKEPSNKDTYTLMLQGAYRKKFVMQANYIFDRTNTWNNRKIEIIKKELEKCLSFFPNDPDLKSIKVILNNYDKLKDYESSVNKACKQEPKCLQDPKYLYLTDNWDEAKTKELLNNIPKPTGKVRNSPIYKETRYDKVQTRLRAAHKDFIEKKMKRAKEEAKSYNHNPHRQGDYRELGQKLYVDFTTYANLWQSKQEFEESWKPEVDSWGKYVEPLEDDKY